MHEQADNVSFVASAEGLDDTSPLDSGATGSSSANRAGAPPPLDADAAQAALGPDVDLVLDGGPVPIGRPSTIVDLSGAALRVLRPGSISEAELLRS